MSALLLLGAVTAASLLAVLDTLGVERTANDLVPHTGQVLDSATTYQHHRVLLQVVAFTWDVGGDLDLARQLDARDLAKRRVRLLRGGGVHAGAYATALRAALQSRGLGLADLVPATLSDQLLNGWHLGVFPFSCLASSSGFQVFVLRLCPSALPRFRVCRTRCAPEGIRCIVDMRIRPASTSLRLGAVSRQARATTIPAAGLAGQSDDRASPRHRRGYACPDPSPAAAPCRRTTRRCRCRPSRRSSPAAQTRASRTRTRGRRGRRRHRRGRRRTARRSPVRPRSGSRPRIRDPRPPAASG